ncbi:tegument protein VP22 [Saimiriine alphaherpesvirus 1]|uniref:Tegument protein VP22 n=1 Tax=Saimiriine herpesvirus 1 (strain MV-5-4-PSL) TaxID=10353 RepID=E2IUC1_SHV1|nr:tegument protein VP22 [Saimiriine alphaherpesvirus 1]ADO13779.1 tegument protein VP22 [Saimiriine alphaherpesvirus 1]
MASRKSTRRPAATQSGDYEDDYYDILTPEGSPDAAARGRSVRRRGGSLAHPSLYADEDDEPEYDWAGSSSRRSRHGEYETSGSYRATPASAGAKETQGRSQSQRRAKSNTRKGDAHASSAIAATLAAKPASAPRAQKSEAAKPSAAKAADGDATRSTPREARAAPGLGVVGSNRLLHFSETPSSSTAAWRGTTPIFNKRIFCAAVGRVAAAHARRAAARLWDMSPPRCNKDLDELLEATNIRITVSEGQRLLARANECLPESTPGGIVGETSERETRPAASSRTAAPKTASTRRPPPGSAS